MKVLFAKFNTERLPEYDILTEIILNDNGSKSALKKPAAKAAEFHIKRIFRNYTLLREKYALSLVEPVLLGNSVAFPLAEGKSLGVLLQNAVRNNDCASVKTMVDRYIAYVQSMTDESLRNTKFSPSQEFIDIFGKWTVKSPQDLIVLPNIDLIFSNLFVNDDKFTLIDYEWVFDFPVPASFIIWRAFNIFAYFYDVDLRQYGYGEYFRFHGCFSKMERNFCTYVYGSDFAQSPDIPLVRRVRNPLERGMESNRYWKFAKKNIKRILKGDD